MGLSWPLIGRSGEIRGIEAAISAPDVPGVVIRGAAGVGKSRIAREALAAAEAAGAQTAVVAASPQGIDIETALALLQARGIGRVLVEGGGKLAASLIAAQAVDRIEWMRAPIALGEEGLPAIGPLKVERVSEAPAWRRVALRELGPDLWESYERV